MRARILRPDEWPRVDVSGVSEMLLYTEPQNIAVCVVEDDSGEIMASVCVLQVTHFEGLWIRPDQRGNAGAFRALIRQAYAVPRVRGDKWALGGASKQDAAMMDICERLGGKQLPMEFYAMRVGD